MAKMIRHKMKFVAKGYKKTFGVDYEEQLAPVSHLDTIRMKISLVAHSH